MPLFNEDLFYERAHQIKDESDQNMHQILEQATNKFYHDEIFRPFDFAQALESCLNNPIEESIICENPLGRMFAILDRRVSKRTLQKICNKKEKMPEWLKSFYKMRFESEQYHTIGGFNL